ncbi:MAG: hypothetical protein QXT73_07100 [Candidatus Methanomethylicaceae archaeon]
MAEDEYRDIVDLIKEAVLNRTTHGLILKYAAITFCDYFEDEAPDWMVALANGSEARINDVLEVVSELINAEGKGQQLSFWE